MGLPGQADENWIVVSMYYYYCHIAHQRDVALCTFTFLGLNITMQVSLLEFEYVDRHVLTCPYGNKHKIWLHQFVVSNPLVIEQQGLQFNGRIGNLVLHLNVRFAVHHFN